MEWQEWFERASAKSTFDDCPNIVEQMYQAFKARLEYEIMMDLKKSTREEISMEWQDISTAPRDGTWFIVIVPESPMCWGPYELASWEPPSGNHYLGIDGEYRLNTDGYYCGTDTSDQVNFTHWMLLPAPPEGDKQ